MDVSIIIVSYNTKALLKQCLQSVFEKTQDIRFEVIVVDNASHDGSAQMVREEFPNVTLVESENKGFGHANNVGAQHAKGTYLFLLNPDTILLNNAVKILFDFIHSHSKVGICGGNLFDENKEPTISYEMYFPSILWELNNGFLGIIGKLQYGKNVLFNHTHQPRKVGFVAGADLMISRNLFNQLNGFDPDFFAYYEETELTFRVKKAGYEVYSIPHAEIIHLEGKTFSGNWKRRSRISLESRGKYYKKTHTRFVTCLCNGIFIFSCLFKFCLFTVLGKSTKVKYFKHTISCVLQK